MSFAGMPEPKRPNVPGRTWSRQKHMNGATSGMHRGWHHETLPAREPALERMPAELPGCPMLVAYDPGRVEAMRAGYSGVGYAR